MKLAIMQPYFLPYIGYFQLINAVDRFVVYDNIEFTKKGWINRNRILVNNKDEYITLPLKKESDFLHVNKRVLSDDFVSDKMKVLRKIKESYRKAPFFDDTYQLLEKIFTCNDSNLFNFILNSIKIVCQYLKIKTDMVISSTININHDLKSEEKVLAICKQLNADYYINPIGGLNLYSKKHFEQSYIELQFLKTKPITYTQNNIFEFTPSLSILDVLMFNSKDFVSEKLNFYELV